MTPEPRSPLPRTNAQRLRVLFCAFQKQAWILRLPTEEGWCQPVALGMGGWEVTDAQEQPWQEASSVSIH